MFLDGKRLVVTGSASGIGARTCQVLKSQGAHIIGLDIVQKTDNVDEFFHVNLLDEASIDAAMAALSGDIDGLCNIAGVPPNVDRARVLKVNFFGLRQLTEGLAGRLPTGASVINVASIAGFEWREDLARIKAALALESDATLEDIEAFCEAHAIDDVFSYLFSKELLIVWTKTLAQRWLARGIRINTVSPGPVDTPILEDFLRAFGKRAEDDVAAIGRAGDPGDIAPVIAFLCSDDSAWINGANIPVDGGLEAIVTAQKLDF